MKVYEAAGLAVPGVLISLSVIQDALRKYFLYFLPRVLTCFLSQVPGEQDEGSVMIVRWQR